VGQALATVDWYFKEKTSKARWSKSIRISSVLLGIAGALLPILALIVGKGLSGEWGFVPLVIGAGVVLLDRAFGFSASWTRYMTAAAAIERRVGGLQLEWTHMQVGFSRVPNDEDTRAAVELLQRFLDEVGEIVERETQDWARDFNAQSSELSELMRSLPPAARG
jgi:hypothetical protein